MKMVLCGLDQIGIYRHNKEKMNNSFISYLFDFQYTLKSCQTPWGHTDISPIHAGTKSHRITISYKKEKGLDTIGPNMKIKIIKSTVA